MKYQHIWDKTLNPNEKVEYEFSVAQRRRVFVLCVWLGLGVCMIFLPVLAAIFALIGLFMYWRLGLNAYAFTSRRVLMHTGWLSTKSTTIGYDKIIEVTVSEPYLDKAFTKSGHLVIKTGGMGHDIILKNIASPYEAKKILDGLSHTHETSRVSKPEAGRTTSDELTALFKLKEQGAITDEEFQGHKKKILSA